jgi:hypothetical protein
MSFPKSQPIRFRSSFSKKKVYVPACNPDGNIKFVSTTVTESDDLLL